MTLPLLEVALPITVALATPVVRSYFRIKYPTPLALGRILPKLCIVDANEILQYSHLLEEELRRTHLRRTVRMNQIRINRSYFAQMALNTRLFQQAVRFEQMKIDPGKPGLDYEPREILVLELVEEAAQLRWNLVKAQAGLFRRALLGMTIDQNTLTSVLGAYKDFEQDIVALTGMGNDSYYRDLLMERLGLTNWRIIDGGGSSAPA